MTVSLSPNLKKAFFKKKDSGLALGLTLSLFPNPNPNPKTAFFKKKIGPDRGPDPGGR